MRIKTTFLCEEEIFVPFTYPYKLSSWIYNVIRNANPLFATEVHEQGIPFRGRKYKAFSFSRLEGKKTKVKNKGLLISGKIELEVVSPLPSFNEAFLRGVYEVPLQINGQQLKPYHVSVEKKPDFKTTMVYSLITPIVYAYQENNRLKFGHPLQWKFYEGVTRSTINRYLAVCQYLNEDPVDLKTHPFYFEFIHEEHFSIRKAAKLICYKGKQIKGYQWPIKVEAPLEIQQFIYYCSISQYVNQGFGFVRVLD